MSALPCPDPIQIHSPERPKGFRWADKVADLSKAHPAARLVLLVIALRANADGTCFPSLKDTANRTGLSVRQVRYHLRTLERLGELKTEHNPGHRNRYQISLTDLCHPGNGLPNHPGNGLPPNLHSEPSYRFGSESSTSIRSSRLGEREPDCSLDVLPNRTEKARDQDKTGAKPVEETHGASQEPRLRLSPSPDTRKRRSSPVEPGKGLIDVFGQTNKWATLAKVRLALALGLDERSALEQSRSLGANLRIVAGRSDRGEILAGWIGHAERLRQTVDVERLCALWQHEVNKSLKSLHIERTARL